VLDRVIQSLLGDPEELKGDLLVLKMIDLDRLFLF
jgi:hypothetical protein